jgi:hypothetical protein
MQRNGLGVGLAISFLLFLPIGLLDFLVAFNYSIGNWAVSSLVLPYLIYFIIAAILGWRGYRRLGKGLAIGGVVFSTLIIVGILLVAFVLSVLAEA